MIRAVLCPNGKTGSPGDFIDRNHVDVPIFRISAIENALCTPLIYVKALRHRVEELIESENDKRRQAEWESEAEKRTERETDAGNRAEQETANEDRTVSETDPGNQAEQETGNGDGATRDTAPGFQVVMAKDNRNLAAPEPDHQAD